MKPGNARLPSLVAVVLLAAGCTIQMVPRTPKPPSPLKGLSTIAVAFDYTGLIVGGMDLNAYLAKKTAEDPTYPKSWAQLTASLEDNVMQGLQSGWGSVRRIPPGEKAADTEAELTVAFASLHIGHYIPFAASNTEVRAALRWAVKGQVAEVQQASGQYPPTLREPSVFQHVKSIGKTLGEAGAGFMRRMQR
jgi:hypothetical protein